MKKIADPGMLMSLAMVGIGHAEDVKPKEEPLTFEQCSLLVQGDVAKIAAMTSDGQEMFLRREDGGDYWLGHYRDPNVKTSMRLWMGVFGPEMEMTAEKSDGSRETRKTTLFGREAIQDALMTGQAIQTSCSTYAAVIDEKGDGEKLTEYRGEGACYVNSLVPRKAIYNGCEIEVIDFEFGLLPQKVENTETGSWKEGTEETDLLGLFYKGTIMTSMPLVLEYVVSNGTTSDFSQPSYSSKIEYFTKIE